MVKNRLKWFQGITKQLIPYQFEFRQSRCTTDPIAALTTGILDGFKEGKTTTTAGFFDIKTSFDIINRRVIIKNLQ